jgi:thiamine biosynthesis lipoprotein
VEHDLASVTVVHEQCVTADALATALTVLGSAEGLELAERSGLLALFIAREEGGALRSLATSRFARSFPAEGGPGR